MTAGHFIFIPSVLLIGVVIGWVLGSRAARDAYAPELQAARRKGRTGGQGQHVVRSAAALQLHHTYLPTASRCASTSGSPAFTTFACASSTA